MTPKVSVIIPAYNAVSYIEDTIASVQAQSETDFELIIIENGSTDGTGDLVRGLAADDPRLRIFETENKGVSPARNRGIEEARAPYLFFLDADDLLAPDALARFTACMVETGAAASYAGHVKIAEDGSAASGGAPSKFRFAPETDTLRALLTKNFIVVGSICVRTDLARQVGGFDPSLKLGEDWEFWCRLALHGDFSRLDDYAPLFYRQRASGANTRLRRSAREITYPALDAIFSNEEIRQRFDEAELRKRRRSAEMDMFWTSARLALACGAYGRFAEYALVGLIRYPDSLFKFRMIYLFFRGVVGMRQA